MHTFNTDEQLALTRACMCTASPPTHQIDGRREQLVHRTHAHTNTQGGSAVSHLDDSVVDGGVLLLPQHHQGDDDHGCYDDASNHQADDGALVGAHVLGEEDLRGVEGQISLSRDRSEPAGWFFIDFQCTPRTLIVHHGHYVLLCARDTAE